jgi:hypothetical protein
MKNIFKLFGIIVLVAVIGFTMAACDDGSNNNGGNPNPDPGGNPFVGNWSGTAYLFEDSAPATANVTNSDWTFSCPDAYMYETGTYTRSGNTATLKQGNITFGTASINGSTLTVTITSGEYQGGSGIFTKGGNPNPGNNTRPGTPTDVSAEALSSSSISIIWKQSSSGGTPTSYNIYRSTSATGTYSFIASTSDRSYTNTGLNASTTYYYKVDAENSMGSSAQSSYAYATTSSGSGGSTVSVTVTNYTGYPVWYLQVKLSSASSWGSDLLGYDVLMNSESKVIQLTPGTYDIRLTDDENYTYTRRNLSIMSNSTVVFQFTHLD